MSRCSMFKCSDVQIFIFSVESECSDVQYSVTPDHVMGESELRLETFLEVIENTGFDIIGGGVEVDLEVGPSNSFFNNWLNYGKYKVTKGANGNCISREYGFYGQGLFFSTWKHQLVR